ncbi:hypothetical protein ACFLU5_06370 [Bacteroidota bacterium]
MIRFVKLILLIPFLISCHKGENTIGVWEMLEDPYNIMIWFGSDENHKFKLWFPELAIFDSDSVRSNYLHTSGKEWYLEVGVSVIISGTIGSDDYTVDFNYVLRSVSNRIEIMLEIKNTGNKTLPSYSQLAVCLSPGAETFSDKSGTGTYVVLNESLQTIRDIGTIDDFNHYPVNDQTDHNDIQERAVVSSGYVGRISKNKDFNCSIIWDKSARVDVNPGGLDCIHSHPSIGPLLPGHTITRYGIIFFEKSPIDDSYSSALEFISNLKSN